MSVSEHIRSNVRVGRHRMRSVPALAAAFVLTIGIESADVKRPASPGNCADQVSFQTFDEVYREIGTAYALDPRLLRPEDRLQALLDVDSFSLGLDTGRLNDWLHAVGIEATEQRISTVLDLLLTVEAAKKIRGQTMGQTANKS